MDDATPTDRLLEKVGGICLIGAPLLMAITSPLWFNDATLFGAGLLQVYAGTLYIPATLALARLLWRPAPRLAIAGGLLGIVGSVGAVNFGSAGLHAWAARAGGADTATQSAIATIVDTQLFPALHLFGITFPITLLILSIGLWRNGVVPTWVAILLGLGAITFPLGRIPSIQVFQHTSDLLLLVSLGWIGLRYLTAAMPGRVVAPATA